MRFKTSDALKHCRFALDNKRRKLWARKVNDALKNGKDEEDAVLFANAEVFRSLSFVEQRLLNVREEKDEDSSDETSSENDEEDDEDEEAGPNANPPEDSDGKPRSDALDCITRHERLSVVPKSFDPETRTADVMISSGAKVRRYDFWTGDNYDEVLEVSPAAVRLQRLNLGAPLLDGHMTYGGLDAIMGAVVPGSARIENGKLMAKVQFSRSDKGQRVAMDLQDGLPVNVSVGYRTHKEIRDETKSPEIRTATDWEPFEVSVVTVPAEAGAGFRQLEPGVHRNRKQENDIMKNNTNAADAGGGASADGGAAGGTPAVTTAAAAPAPEAARAAPAAPAATTAPVTTTAPVAEMLAVAREASLDIAVVEQAVRDNLTMDAFRALVINKLLERQKGNPGPQGATNGNVEVLRDENEGRADAMVEALSTRILAARRIPAIVNQEQADWVARVGRVDMIARSFRVMDGKDQPAIQRASQYMRMGFVELAAECIGFRGSIRTPRQAEEVLMRAFQSSSDYPNIFANVLNKVLLARYQLAMPTYREIAAERQFNDFRPHPQIRAGDFPTLQPLTETGELKAGGSQDSREDISVSPYGVTFNVSRQMIVNDDLGAVDQMLANAGQRVLVFENTTFYAMFNSNPVLKTDTTAVFAAGHTNLDTPGGHITVTNVGEARKRLRQQKSLGGDFLNIPPSILLTGPVNETAADQIVASITPQLTTSVNPFSGKLRSISDANITDTSWYIACDPQLLPCFVYGFLNGSVGPRIRTDEPFGVQGIRMSLEHDFGVGAIDFRGFDKNAGAGTSGN